VPHWATVCQAEIGGGVQIEQPTIATTRATANWFARYVRLAADVLVDLSLKPGDF
jgi:hypothetical protein